MHVDKMSYSFRRAIRSALIETNTVTFCRTVASTSLSLFYQNNGDPLKVVQAKTETLRTMVQDDVIVEMLAAPINPADINMIQGIYPVKPNLPAIGGNEGVGKIVKKGNSVSNLQIGDWVVPVQSGWGTWRTHAVCKAHEVMKIPNNIPIISAATMAVNPCTAYRMLRDFVTLKRGDVVIQNAANSGVAQAVIQLAADMGVITVNVIRERPGHEQLADTLKSLGATYVIADTALNSKEGVELLKCIDKPKLALNGVGGKSAGDLARVLGYGGIMVTYGGMSKQPMLLPTSSFIFNDVTVRGFWMTRWNSQHQTSTERHKMWVDLCEMVRKDKLKPPKCDLVPLKDYQQAIKKSMESYTSTKQLLTMYTKS